MKYRNSQQRNSNSQQRNGRHKEKPTRDFRTEKYNNQIQKLSEWAQY